MLGHCRSLNTLPPYPQAVRLGIEGDEVVTVGACRRAAAAAGCLSRLWCRLGHQFVAQRRCLTAQRPLHLLLDLAFVFLHTLLDVLLAVLEHPVDQASQLMSRCST